MASVAWGKNDTSCDLMIHEVDDMGYVKTDPYMEDDLVFEQYATMIGTAMKDMHDSDVDDQTEESGKYDITTCANVDNMTDDRNGIASQCRENDTSIDECHGITVCAEKGSHVLARRKRKQDWSNGVTQCVI